MSVAASLLSAALSLAPAAAVVAPSSVEGASVGRPGVEGEVEGEAEGEDEEESETAGALDGPARRYHQRRTGLGLGGMATLTGWSVANIAGGLAGNFTTTGERRFFHQGNAAWNSVNLVLGIVGLVGSSRERREPVNLTVGAERATRAQFVFLVNAGLDVVYMGAGVASWAVASDPGVVAAPLDARLRGYGQALVLQGAFLFVFDVAMAWSHRILLEQARHKRTPKLQLSPMAGPVFGPGRGLHLGVAGQF